MNLDNIQDSTDFSHIEQNLQTIKTIKTVAKEIIAFLAQLEDFQKKLWLKKKFVAGCHYLITLDHLTEAQVQAALENPKQTAQWQDLFNVNTSGLNAAELCKIYPHLVVDTALFEPKFQAEVLGNLSDLDKQTDGLLIHSDNFQALNLLQERYKEQVKCIYIDPPYFSGIYEKSLNAIKNIVGGIIILEHVTDVDLTGYEVIKQKKYGDKFITFLRKDFFEYFSYRRDPNDLDTFWNFHAMQGILRSINLSKT